MVWFQCDDCDDNLKKPALPNHFRRCRASRFSCIDCGAKFDRESVQQHTQCVTEAEKYGPKGTAAAAKNKSNANGGAVPEEIVAMGLSTKPPWSCSLCKIKATGRDVLLVHGQSKRHGSKARAAIAARNPPPQPAAVEKSTKSDEKSTVLDEKSPVEPSIEKTEEAAPKDLDEKSTKTKKKRKREGKEKENISKNVGEEEQHELGKEENIPSEIDLSKVVGWRKLIAREIKKSEDGSVKKRKLEKAVIPAAMEAIKAAGIEERLELDAAALKPLLDNYLATSKRFSIEGKSVRKTIKTAKNDES